MDWLKNIVTGITDEQIEAFKQELPKHFIPKDQYNKKVDELKLKAEEYGTLESQLASNQSLLSELKKKADLTDEYKGKLDAQVNEISTFKADAEKRIANMQKQSMLERKLIDAKAAPDAVDLLLKEFDIDSIELTDDGIKGFDELIKPIQEKRKSLFVTESHNSPPPKDNTNTPPATLEAQIAQAMGIKL